MILEGVIQHVEVDPLGGALTQAPTDGGYTLTLDDVIDFNAGDDTTSAGGSLILGVVYDYVTVDADANTITLDPDGDPATGGAEDEVLVANADGSAAFERLVWVVIDDGGPVPALTTDHDHFPEGDELAGALVDVRATDEGWEVVGTPRTQRAPLDLTYADPTTIPEYEPTEPPAFSPSIRVTGNVTSLVVVAENVAPSTTIDYYLDGALVKSTRSTVVVISEDSTGSPLEEGVSYLVHVVARNEVGAAAPSEAMEGRLNSGISAEMILAIVAAGYVLAGEIQVGNITISPDDGIRIPLASGGEIHFPADGSEAAVEAALRTSDLVINGGLAINGATNQLNGTLTMASGVPNPSTTPPISTDPWIDNIALSAVGGTSGLCSNEAGGRWAIIALDEQWAGQVRVCSAVGGGLMQSISFAGANDFLPISITRGGSSYFVLGLRWNPAGSVWDYRVQRYDMALTLTGSWFVPSASGGRVRPGDPNNLEGGIAFDASDSTLWIATRLPSGSLAFRHHALAGGYLGVVTTADQPSGLLSHGLYVGNADVGTTLFYASVGNNVRAWNTSGGRVASHDFAGGGSAVRGLWWDGTQFWTHSGSFAGIYDTVLHKHSQSLGSTGDLAITWYDSDPAGGPHETKPSPRKTVTVPRRGFARVSLGAPPDDGSSDGADSTRLYTSAAPGGTLRLLKTLTHSSSFATWLDPVHNAAGAVPPTTNNFSTSSNVGQLQSSATGPTGPLVDIHGNGYVRLWTLIQSGEVTITPSAAGVNESVAVTFATPFTAAPTVTVAPNALSANVNRVRATSVTTTGFALTLNRSDTTATICQWQAIAKTQ